MVIYFFSNVGVEDFLVFNFLLGVWIMRMRNIYLLNLYWLVLLDCF